MAISAAESVKTTYQAKSNISGVKIMKSINEKLKMKIWNQNMK